MRRICRRGARLVVVGVVVTVGCRAAPTFTTIPVLGGLDHAWDIAFAHSTAALVTTRPSR